MHAWAKDYVELVYPAARDRIILEKENSTLTVNLQGYFEKYQDYKERSVDNLGSLVDTMMIGVHIFGTLSLAAAELGNKKTLDGLINYADQNMHPTWKNGGYFYPRNDNLGGNDYTTNLVGNALLAGARLCPKNGFWNLYNKPWTESELSLPEVCDVDYPNVIVSKATYEDGGDTILIKLCPGTSSEEMQSFSISRINEKNKYKINIDNNTDLIVHSDHPKDENSESRAIFDSSKNKVIISLKLNCERSIRFESIS